MLPPPPQPSEDTPFPADAPLPTRKEQTDKFVREELRRVVADRHIRDAVDFGDLKALEPPDEQLLAKIKTDLTPHEVEALRRAIFHERSCSKSYRVARNEAIRWAASQRELFPDFPFPFDGNDLPPSAAGESVAADTIGLDEILTPENLARRAAWVKDRLEREPVAAKRLHELGGPDPKTLTKILNAEPVGEIVLRRLAKALNADRTEIP